MIYGYCCISKKIQKIERQERNIKDIYPNAIIIKETFTGTKLYNRKSFIGLLKIVKSGDTIVFDSVSGMSRNSQEGINIYMELYNKSIELVFLKELISILPLINKQCVMLFNP